MATMPSCAENETISVQLGYGLQILQHHSRRFASKLGMLGERDTVWPGYTLDSGILLDQRLDDFKLTQHRGGKYVDTRTMVQEVFSDLPSAGMGGPRPDLSPNRLLPSPKRH